MNESITLNKMWWKTDTHVLNCIFKESVEGIWRSILDRSKCFHLSRLTINSLRSNLFTADIILWQHLQREQALVWSKLFVSFLLIVDSKMIEICLLPILIYRYELWSEIQDRHSFKIFVLIIKLWNMLV